MNFLQGHKIIYKENELVPAEVALKKKNLILYYFTSGTCEACAAFDVKLRQVYQEALVQKVEMAIIVISFDSDKETFNNTYKTNYSNWYGVPYNSELIHTLALNFGVTHIPQLVVVRRNGDLVTREGKTDVEKIGINVLVTWAE